MEKLNNLNVASQDVLPTPAEIKARLPVTEKAAQTVSNGRQTVQSILEGKDSRRFIVLGPCSIHDIDAAHDYARRLAALADEVKDTFFLIMRVYFEKPRTTTGWKGLINDPDMNDSFHIDRGIELARKLLLDLAEMGIPTATEALDPIMPQYLSDLITWTAIGARTTESQTHREMASGLSTPVGFKNSTDGSISVATNAIKSASHPHNFLGINQDGQSAVIRTKGNTYGHIVLRGGAAQTNYDSVSIALCESELEKAKLPLNIVVDCSHANSLKKHELQPLVMENCVNQMIEGNRSIVGLMIESNINEGNQPIPEDLTQLKYGVSVTDACVNWETTDTLIRSSRDNLLKAKK